MKRRLTSTGLAVLVGLTGSLLIKDAIAPSVAQAYVSRVDVAIDVVPGEAYETVLRRAESVARAAAQRSFDRDILISEVSVIIVGKNRGASVQVLSLKASRTQWRSRPDARRWATYYPSAKPLLGLGGGMAPAAAPSSPIVVTTPASSPPQPPTPPAGFSPAAPTAAPSQVTPTPISPPIPIAPPAPIFNTPTNTTPLPPGR